MIYDHVISYYTIDVYDNIYMTIITEYNFLL